MGNAVNPEIPTRRGINEAPPIEGNPFDLARSTCRHALDVARDVSIDDTRLLEFAGELKAREVANVTNEHMGENADTLPDQFEDARDAVNFAVFFSLLQFGHGFRRELHRFCGVWRF